MFYEFILDFHCVQYFNFEIIFLRFVMALIQYFRPLNKIFIQVRENLFKFMYTILYS